MAHDTQPLDRLFLWRGRTSRRTFWLAALGGFVAFVVAAAITPTAGSVVLALLLVPAWLLSVRRLHDAGTRAWHLLWGFLPYVGVVIVVIFLSLAGQRRTNDYGPPPGRRAATEPSPPPVTPPASTVAPPRAPSSPPPTTTPGRPTSTPTRPTPMARTTVLTPSPTLAQLRAVLPPRSTAVPTRPVSVRPSDPTPAPQAAPPLDALRAEVERHRRGR